MRCYWIFVVGLLALLLHKQSLLAQIVPLPQSNSVKLRLEIEIQGKLSVTEKLATITSKETVFELVKDPDAPAPQVIGAGRAVMVMTASGWARAREVDKVWVLELDENLKKTAKTLHGKEIVLTGKCLLLGVASQAKTVKTPASIGSGKLPGVRGNPPVEIPVVVPGGFDSSVQSQLLLDNHVTVISLKAAK